jgi:hypothetical protein
MTRLISRLLIRRATPAGSSLSAGVCRDPVPPQQLDCPIFRDDPEPDALERLQ